ncbi:unnamed protein product [Pylaiella littoralis]
MMLHQPFLRPQQQQYHQQPQHLVSDVREAADRAELQKKWQRIDDVREKVESLQEQMIADLLTQRDAEKSARLAAERKTTELEAAAAVRIQQDAARFQAAAAAAAAAVRTRQDEARFQAEADEAAILEVGVPEAATAVESRGDGGHLALQCTLGSGEKAARLQAESPVEESSLEPAGLLFHRILEDIAVEETTPLQTRGSGGTRRANDRDGTGIVSGDGRYSGDVDGPRDSSGNSSGDRHTGDRPNHRGDDGGTDTGGAVDGGKRFPFDRGKLPRETEFGRREVVADIINRSIPAAAAQQQQQPHWHQWQRRLRRTRQHPRWHRWQRGQRWTCQQPRCGSGSGGYRGRTGRRDGAGGSRGAGR